MADYTKSPVFSSPSYWIALGVGVVGIGAAAMQERKGSAAKVYDTPFDPSTLSDKPGSASPRQIAILMSMGALLPDGKDVHGKTMRVSNRQAAGLIRSMGEMRRADKAGMRGSAARRLSSINAQDGHEDGGNITQQRVDADQAMFNHRFGGLVQNRKGLPRPITKRAAIDAAEANHTLWSLLEPGYAGGTYLRPGRIQTRIAYYQSKLPWTDADRDTRLEIAQSKTPYSSRLERKY